MNKEYVYLSRLVLGFNGSNNYRNFSHLIAEFYKLHIHSGGLSKYGIIKKVTEGFKMDIFGWIDKKDYGCVLMNGFPKLY